MSSVISIGDVASSSYSARLTNSAVEATSQFIRVTPNYHASCLWVEMTFPYFSLDLIRSLLSVSQATGNLQTSPFRYRVLTSSRASVFSLGGDLRFFRDCIENCQTLPLRYYAECAVNAIWESVSGSGYDDLTSVALVEGEAQGGGFEAALASHVLVAEKGAVFGFPESLFGLFPGMGGRLLLAARASNRLAEDAINHARRYSAEELYDLGVVDFLAEPGEGRSLVDEVVRDISPSELALLKSRFASITRPDLLTTVEYWVDAAMSLGRRHLRAITYLIDAQDRAMTNLVPNRSMGITRRAAG